MYDFSILVDMRRIELLSENMSISLSTGLVCGYKFPRKVSRKQGTILGSFIVHGMLKALHTHVHRVVDA